MRLLQIFIILTLFFGTPLLVSAITCPAGCSPGSLNPNQCVDAGGEVCPNLPPNNNPNNPSPNTNPGTTLINPLKANSLQEFLTGILDLIIRIGAIVVILMLVYVGFMFVSARGEPGKLTTAREALLWTIVGALILLGAKAIQIGIENTVRAIGG